MPLAGAGTIFADDPSWFAPPVERVSVEAGKQDDVQDLEDTAHGEESAPAPPPRLPPPTDH
jgi:hypothetical protein